MQIRQQILKGTSCAKGGNMSSCKETHQLVESEGFDITNAHIVDCDAMPEILSDWQKEEHRKGGSIKIEHREGKLYVNGQEVIRFLSKKQKDGKVVGGHELRRELKDKQVLNACVLDYLLRHTELIPEWKSATYFWGTIFRGSGGNLYVAYLLWDGGWWYWDYDWLGHGWDGYEPAACLASS